MPKVISYTVRKSVFSIKRLQAYWIGLLLVLTSCVTTWGQPILNERVDLQPTNYTGISNIEIANDSTYIFVGDGYDSTINKTYIIIFATDTVLNIKWSFKIIDSIGNNTSDPLDDSFFTNKIISLSKSTIENSLLYSFNRSGGSDSLILIRFNTSGDILDTGYFDLSFSGQNGIIYSYFPIEYKSDSSLLIITDNYDVPEEFTSLNISKNFHLQNLSHFQEPASSSPITGTYSSYPPKLYKDSLLIVAGGKKIQSIYSQYCWSSKN